MSKARRSQLIQDLTEVINAYAVEIKETFGQKTDITLHPSKEDKRTIYLWPLPIEVDDPSWPHYLLDDDDEKDSE